LPNVGRRKVNASVRAFTLIVRDSLDNLNEFLCLAQRKGFLPKTGRFIADDHYGRVIVLVRDILAYFVERKIDVLLFTRDEVPAGPGVINPSVLSMALILASPLPLQS